MSARGGPAEARLGPVDEERKRHNYVIAAAVGGFLLPLAGAVGAMIFWARDDRRAAATILSAAIAGLLVYALLFAVL